MRLKVLFHGAMIFRIFSDDFILLCNTNAPVDTKALSKRLGVGFKPIEISMTHFPFEEIPFKHWEEFEPYLQKPTLDKKG